MNNQWFRFFLGTPQRFLTSMVALGLIVVMIQPQILYDAVNHFLAAISPLLGPVMALLIVFAGIRIIVRGFK